MTNQAITNLVESFMDASVVASLMMKRLNADDLRYVIETARGMGIKPGRAQAVVQEAIDAGLISADEVNAMHEARGKMFAQAET